MKIPMVGFDITSNCNLACLHCRVHELEADCSYEEVCAMVDKLAPLEPKVMFITGGEPLIRDDIVDIVKYIAAKGYQCQLNTNGLLLTEGLMRELAEAGLGFMQISLDGPRHVHESLRGPGTFDAAVDAIELASGYVQVVVNTTLSRMNLETIPEMAEYVLVERGLRPRVFGLKRFIANKQQMKEYVLGPRGVARLLEILADLRARFGNLTEFRTDAPQTNQGNEERVRRIMRQIGLSCGGCSAGVASLHVRANGDVAPCSVLDVTIGNMKTQTLDELLAAMELWGFADRAKLKGHCGLCDVRDVCGGCRAAALAEFGDPMEEDPECPRYLT